MAIIEQTGVLKQVDDKGNVVVLYPAVKTDSTLLESGAPADAAAVGEALKNVKPADSSVTLTQVEYDALSDEEKNNGTTYFISDANGECDATQVSFSSSNYTATNVAGALEEVNSSLKAYSGYGAPVDITSKSSESNPYTVPSDGIIYLQTSGENGVIYMAVVGGFTIGCTSNSQYNSDTTILPVFKGMKLFETTSSAGSRRALFIPYTEDNN